MFGWRGATGFDERYRSLGPGTYTLLRMLEELCREPGISEFDFGPGEARYKRALADRIRYEETLRIFGKGIRPLAVNTMVAGLNAAKRGGYGLVGAWGRMGDPSRSIGR